MKRLYSWGSKAAALAALVLLLTGCNVRIPVLNPAGPVARSQFNLIIWSFILMMIIVAVVFILFAVFVIKYRKKPGDEEEPPQIEGNTKLEFIWTIIPIIIVILLAIPTVSTTFNLEKSPAPDKKPMTIKVISADWKWIFQYPEEGIETVNYLHIPKGVPIHFEMTSADAMNSFWIPSLGGQKYTMAGMDTEMWLMADSEGKYLGRAANFSGRGFAHMQFDVVSQNVEDYDKWVKKVKATAPKLTRQKHMSLLSPGTVTKKMTFSSYSKDWPVISTILRKDGEKAYESEHHKY